MRGSMRNESALAEMFVCVVLINREILVSRLMYAAGDVREPDLDAVDYMEDLVVEFIADLVSYSSSRTCLLISFGSVGLAR